MLLQLEIRDFAIIEHTLLDFEEGFGVLTGETGAGKSIILDALNCILGDRASKSLIRKGSSKAYLKAVFLKSSILLSKLSDLNITNNDDFVVVEREIFQNGKSFAKINGSLVTTQTIRDLCEDLIEICGQRDHQQLLKDTTYIELLDTISQNELREDKNSYLIYFEEYKDLQNKINDLMTDQREREQLLDLYSFQIDEIEKADLVSGEDVTLNEERIFLSSFEKISKNVSTAVENMNVVGNLYGAMQSLQNATKYDEHIKPILERFEKLYFEFEDVTSEINDYAGSLSFDEERLNEVISRIHFISTLKRKYADDIDSILAYRDDIFAKLDQMKNRDEHLDKYRSRQSELVSMMDDLCDRFDRSRRHSAIIQEEQIARELAELCMPSAVISFHIEKTEQFNAQGKNKVSLLFCANKGEDLKPISKIASGGELSRVLLAFKIAMQNSSGVSTLIFDEVDEGIGGEVGRHIGLKLRELSKHVQVIVISHLPQVASKGHYHFIISKMTKEERTVSSVQKLEHDQRKFEIARMIYGDATDSVTLEQAELMLK